MSSRAPDPDDIRLMVRELLRELLPAVLGAGHRLIDRLRNAVRDDGGNGPVGVAVRSDEELNAFARAMAEVCREPGAADAIASGRVHFRLEGRAASPPPPGSTAGAPAAPLPAPAGTTATAARAAELRVDAGVLSEKRIAEMAKTNRRLVLGPRAVLTPLGRDRARELGIEIVRSRT